MAKFICEDVEGNVGPIGNSPEEAYKKYIQIANEEGWLDGPPEIEDLFFYEVTPIKVKMQIVIEKIPVVEKKKPSKKVVPSV